VFFLFLLSTIPNITAMYKNFFHIYLNITYIHISIRPIFSVKSEQKDGSHFFQLWERERNMFMLINGNFGFTVMAKNHNIQAGRVCSCNKPKYCSWDEQLISMMVFLCECVFKQHKLMQSFLHLLVYLLETKYCHTIWQKYHFQANIQKFEINQILWRYFFSEKSVFQQKFYHKIDEIFYFNLFSLVTMQLNLIWQHGNCQTTKFSECKF